MDKDNVQLTSNLSYCETCKIWLNYGGVSSDIKLNPDVPKYLYDMEHCQLCHRIWDGNAQCPC